MTTETKRNREARLAAALARRGTPEWQAAGERLLAERAAAEEARREAAARERRARDEARRVARIDDDPDRFDREVARLSRRLEVAVADARGDYPDVSDEDLYHDLWLSLRRDAVTDKVRRAVEQATFGFTLEWES